MLHTGRGEVDMFNNVMQRDVSVKACGSSESGRGKACERGERILRCSKCGKDQVVPHDVGLQTANRSSKGGTDLPDRRISSNGSRRNLATHGAAATRSACRAGRLRKSILSEFVCQDRKFDVRKTPQRIRDVERRIRSVDGRWVGMWLRDRFSLALTSQNMLTSI